MEEMIYFVLSKGEAIIIEGNIKAGIMSRKDYFTIKKSNRNSDLKGRESSNFSNPAPRIILTSSRLHILKVHNFCENTNTQVPSFQILDPLIDISYSNQNNTIF